MYIEGPPPLYISYASPEQTKQEIYQKTPEAAGDKSQRITKVEIQQWLLSLWVTKSWLILFNILKGYLNMLKHSQWWDYVKIALSATLHKYLGMNGVGFKSLVWSNNQANSKVIKVIAYSLVSVAYSYDFAP